MMSKGGVLEAVVPNEDLWVLLVSTVRYALGRQSYMPSLARDLVLKYRNNLTSKEIYQISSEISTFIDMREKVKIPVPEVEVWNDLIRKLAENVS